MTEARLTHLRRPEVMAAEFEVAVLPIGSTEPHAQHLPYGTDVFVAGRFAQLGVEEANRRGARCLLLPTLPYGCNTNLDHVPWGMSLQPRILMDVVSDIVASVARQGVRKVLIVNAHGGNTSSLLASLRELYEKTSAFVAMVEQWTLSSRAEAEIRETAETGHACEIETSLLLHLYPDRVAMEAAEPTRVRKTIFSDREGVNFVSPWHAYTLNTGIGDPTKATAEKGRRMIEAGVERLAAILKDLSDAPMTDLFPFVD